LLNKKIVYLKNINYFFLVVVVLSFFYIIISGEFFERLFPLISRLLILYLILLSISIVLYNQKALVVFEKYISVSYFFASLSLVFELAFIFTGYHIGQIIPTIVNKTYGVFLGSAGLSAEPAFFAVCLLPAGIYSFFNIFLKRNIKLKYVIVFSATLFTTSSLAIIGIFIAGVL
ncbi:hypothetical protein AB4490_24545, partial [Vibrio cyclitrophicus]